MNKLRPGKVTGPSQAPQWGWSQAFDGDQGPGEVSAACRQILTICWFPDLWWNLFIFLICKTEFKVSTARLLRFNETGSAKASFQTPVSSLPSAFPLRFLFWLWVQHPFPGARATACHSWPLPGAEPLLLIFRVGFGRLGWAGQLTEDLHSVPLLAVWVGHPLAQDRKPLWTVEGLWLQGQSPVVPGRAEPRAGSLRHSAWRIQSLTHSINVLYIYLEQVPL